MYRDQTIDIMKGIAILAMIAGHCFIPFALHEFIYLWHMPLFFVVSGFFYRMKSFEELLSSTWKGLIGPYIVTSVVLLSITLVKDIITGYSSFVVRLINQVAITGLMDDPSKYGDFLYNAGPIWFLLALAWCRGMYAIVNKFFSRTFIITIIVIFTSFWAWFWGKDHFVPFFISQGLVGVIFYHIGYMMGQYKKVLQDNTKLLVVLGFCSVFVGMSYCKMDIWGLYMSCWPANVIIATLIVFAIYVIVYKIQLSCLFQLKSLSYMGRMSILILALHAIEKSFDIVGLGMACIPVLNSNSIGFRFMKIVLQFLFCIIGLNFVKRIKLICKIYNIK